MSEWKETKSKILKYSIPISPNDQYPEYITASVEISENIIYSIRMEDLYISAFHISLLEKLFAKLRGDGFKTIFDEEPKESEEMRKAVEVYGKLQGGRKEK